MPENIGNVLQIMHMLGLFPLLSASLHNYAVQLKLIRVLFHQEANARTHWQCATDRGHVGGEAEQQQQQQQKRQPEQQRQSH